MQGIQGDVALEVVRLVPVLRENARDLIIEGEMGRRDMVMVEAIYASAAAGGKRIEVKI